MPKKATVHAQLSGPALGAASQYVKLLLVMLNDSRQLKAVLKENRTVLSDLVVASAAAGGAAAGVSIWASSLGFWPSIACALGLVSTPLWVPVAGGVGGLTAAVLASRYILGRVSAADRLNVVTLSYHAAHLMARADRVKTEAETDFLNNLLLGTGLNRDQIKKIEKDAPRQIENLSVPEDVVHEVRSSILVACWQLALADGIDAQEERMFEKLRLQFQVDTQSVELKSAAQELSHGASATTHALLKATVAITPNQTLVSDEVVQAILCFDPSKESREKLRATARVGTTIAAAGTALAAAYSGNPQLLRATIKAYGLARTCLRDDDPDSIGVLQTNALELAERLGLPVDEAKSEIDLLENSVSQDLCAIRDRCDT